MIALIDALETACDKLRGSLPYHWQRIRTLPVSSDETLIKLVERQVGVHVVRVNKQSALQIGGFYIVLTPRGDYRAACVANNGKLRFIEDQSGDGIAEGDGQPANPIDEPDNVGKQQLPSAVEMLAVDGGASDALKPSAANVPQLLDDEISNSIPQYQVFKASLLDHFELRRLISADPVSVSLIKKLLFGSLFINLMVVVTPLYLNAIYSRILPAYASASLWAFSVGVILAGIAEYLLRRDRQRLNLELVQRLHTTLEPNIIRRLLRINVSQSNEWGARKFRSLNDWRQVRNFGLMALNANIIDVPFMLLFLIFIALLGHWVVIVPILVIAVIIGLMVHSWREAAVAYNVRPLHRDAPNVADLKVASIIGRPDVVSDRFMADSESETENWKQRYQRSARSQRANYAINAGQTVVIVICAYYLVVAGSLNQGAIFAVILLAGRMMQPLLSASSIVYDAYGARQAYKNIKEVIAQSSEATETALHLEKQENLKTPLWNIEQGSFYYNSEKIVLDNLQLSIPNGQKVAIFGPANSGKTTLLQLLAGYLSLEKGTIAFSKRPLHAGDETVKRLVHYDWQDHVMLTSSVYEFLCLEERLSREECENILHQLDLVSGEMQIADKLEVTWRDAGFYPNPAHRQMLASARLALSKRKIFLLDEPTSQLSQKQESRVANLLKNKLTPDTTMVVVTDRYDMLALTERVIVLDQGHIKFDGSTKEFLQRSTRNIEN